MESKNHAENLLKTEKFHNFKCHAYPHTKSNISNGIVRSKELSLATPEEIETTFKKQGIKEYRRVTIHRNDETIQTHMLYSHLHITTTQHQRQTHEGKRLKD